MKAIEIKALSKNFGKIKAVDNISFSVDKGEIFGFLGPNGAGKTTTIRCLMDFIRPDEGNIKILRLDSKKDSVEIKRKIGYLAPEPRLYDNLTGTEHFSIIEKIRGKGKRKEELIEKMGADPHIKIKNLSTGNKQKLSLIIALMHDPDIVIMDEPTTGLDPLLQNVIYEILEKMSKEGKTIFMSSHNLSEVEKICQRVAIIRRGRLVAVENIKKINEKKIYKLWIFLKNQGDLAELQKIKGIQIEAKSGSEVYLNYNGDITSVIRYLSKIRVNDIKIEHAGLEEMFINFYK